MIRLNSQKQVETVKELIAEMTPFAKERQEVISAGDSQDIRINCTNCCERVFKFKYVAGELFLWADAAEFWLSVNESQYMNDLFE